MSVKPDDVPQDVWYATEALPIHGDGFCDNDDLVTIARAIMAAERRGEERELEACACRVDLVADGIAGLPVKSEDVKIASGALVDVLRTLSADFRKRQSELG